MSDQAAKRLEGHRKAADGAATNGGETRTFFGHPWTMRYIVNVEVWDQFSYFGLQAILLTYLMYSATDGGLGLPQTTAVGLVGAYAGMTYLATVASAWVADRLLGCELTLFLSACVVAAGHVALAALPGMVGLIVGLIMISIGSGGVKSGATSSIGGLYAPTDRRRDTGFSLYYMAIKFGALGGPVVVGLVQVFLGFHVGFAVAAGGMFIGLAYYSAGRRHLPNRLKGPDNPLTTRVRLYPVLVSGATIAITVTLTVLGLVTLDNVTIWIIVLSGLAVIAVLTAMLGDRSLTSLERRQVVAILPSLALLVLFSAAFVVQYSMLVIFADKRVDRDVNGFEFPVAWAAVFIAIAAVLFTPPIAAMWVRLGTRQPSTLGKMALGMIMMGLAIVAYLTMTGSAEEGAPIWGLILVAVLVGISEALCVPNSFSLSSKLAPESYPTQMVSLTFLAVAVGSPLGAGLARLYSPSSEVTYFIVVGLLYCIVGLSIFFAASRIMKLLTKSSARY